MKYSNAPHKTKKSCKRVSKVLMTLLSSNYPEIKEVHMSLSHMLTDDYCWGSVHIDVGTDVSDVDYCSLKRDTMNLSSFILPDDIKLCPYTPVVFDFKLL